MSPLRPWLRAVILVALCLTSLWSAVRQCVKHAAPSAPLITSDYFRRFDGLRPFLPPEGELGYVLPLEALKAVADPARPSFHGMDHDLLARSLSLHYLLTQQAVAPRHLVLSDQHEIIVGNFLSEELVPIWPAEAPHRVVAQGTDGVRLLVLRGR